MLFTFFTHHFSCRRFSFLFLLTFSLVLISPFSCLGSSFPSQRVLSALCPLLPFPFFPPFSFRLIYLLIFFLSFLILCFHPFFFGIPLISSCLLPFSSLSFLSVLCTLISFKQTKNILNSVTYRSLWSRELKTLYLYMKYFTLGRENLVPSIYNVLVLYSTVFFIIKETVGSPLGNNC